MSARLRLALTSDLHLDMIADPDRRALVLEVLAESLVAAAPDIVIVAGDVANHPALVPELLAPLALGRLANLYVPGNHCVWRTRKEKGRGASSDEALVMLAHSAAQVGFHSLQAAPRLIGGWGFAGSIGWYDYSFANPELRFGLLDYAKKDYHGDIWQDRTFALWREGDHRLSDPEASDRFVARLEADLLSLGAGNLDGPPIVAVTHHLTDREQVLAQGFAAWDYFNAFMGSAALGALFDRYPAVRASLAGHTHRVQRHVFPSGRLAVVSPLGEYGSADYPRHPAERIALLELNPDTRQATFLGTAAELGEDSSPA